MFQCLGCGFAFNVIDAFWLQIVCRIEGIKFWPGLRGLALSMSYTFGLQIDCSLDRI